MVSVCFRFDDPSPVGDHELERRVFDTFARFNIPLCVATIPFAPGTSGELIPLSLPNAVHLVDASRAGTIEIAQHGHSQIHRGNTDRGVRSEFAGVRAAEQLRLIVEGRAQLASLFNARVKGFVPPWNTYDHSTLRALGAAGFEFLSAGPEFIKFDALPVVPTTCNLHNARDALERALSFQLLAPLLVVVFHPDDFAEFKFPPCPDEPPPFTSLLELEALLDWIIRHPRIQPEALSRIAESVRNGLRLRNPSELNLPYRVKALIPPILVTCDEWTIVPGGLWGAFRSRWRFGV